MTNTVLLLAPLRPTIPNTSPGYTVKEILMHYPYERAGRPRSQESWSYVPNCGKSRPVFPCHRASPCLFFGHCQMHGVYDTGVSGVKCEITEFARKTDIINLQNRSDADEMPAQGTPLCYDSTRKT